MGKISINMMYWDGNDILNRRENALFCWERLKLFYEYSKEYKLDLSINLFDFSEKKIFTESIHIPYKKGVYKRSEKINLVLEYNYLNINPDIICFVDSDVFFIENDFKKLIEELTVFNDNEMIICDILDIDDKKCIDFQNLNFIYNPNTTKRLLSGLGAFFIINFKKLFNIGGFDERFTVWGGEDDDIGIRLIENGLIKKYTSINIFHLPHEILMNEINRNEDYYNQCKIIGNNDIITNNSIIKKYLN